jgi:hypothetical protein
LSRHFALQLKNFVQVKFVNWLANKTLHRTLLIVAPVSFER